MCVDSLVASLSDAMLAPRHGPGVCVECFNFTRGFRRCYACGRCGRHLDLVVPISYSVAHEPLHQALYGYKRKSGLAAERATAQIAAVLWRFLQSHEDCLAQALSPAQPPQAQRADPATPHPSRSGHLDLITTVPSSDGERDETHPLRHIVGELVAPTRERHERVLRRSEVPLAPHVFDVRRYVATRELDGATVLLIDDTWTTGANAQSAAAALKAAGATAVAAVVVGRHLNREWHENDQQLRRMARPFDLSTCVLCADAHDARAAA